MRDSSLNPKPHWKAPAWSIKDLAESLGVTTDVLYLHLKKDINAPAPVLIGRKSHAFNRWYDKQTFLAWWSTRQQS